MKVSLIVLGVVIIAFLFGLAVTPKISTAKSEVLIAAPPQRVWQVMTDVTDQPSWRKNLKQVILTQGDRAHPEKWTEVLRGGSEIHFQTIRLTAPSLWELSFKSNSMQGTWQGKLEAQGNATKLVLTEEAEIPNPFVRVVFSVSDGLGTFVDNYINGLKASAESR